MIPDPAAAPASLRTETSVDQRSGASIELSRQQLAKDGVGTGSWGVEGGRQGSWGGWSCVGSQTSDVTGLMVRWSSPPEACVVNYLRGAVSPTVLPATERDPASWLATASPALLTTNIGRGPANAMTYPGTSPRSAAVHEFLLHVWGGLTRIGMTAPDCATRCTQTRRSKGSGTMHALHFCETRDASFLWVSGLPRRGSTSQPVS